jgi:hypothetical protein
VTVPENFAAKLNKKFHHGVLKKVGTDSKNLFIGQYDKFFEEYWLSPIL